MSMHRHQWRNIAFQQTEFRTVVLRTSCHELRRINVTATFSAHLFAGGEVDEMLHAGVTGEGRNSVASSLCRMTVSAYFNFDLDQIRAGDGRARDDSANAKGP
ncbi:hypothetical protein [Bradyrhizobium liaoningense]|uniref:hypothetical protein n=1 Tax=Bradyrhizobium liaoningense TaxID=43992 RepID=UPI0012FD3C02|nr:hypothetical protein [Bradyrhizobium liaoningense]